MKILSVLFALLLSLSAFTQEYPDLPDSVFPDQPAIIYMADALNGAIGGKGGQLIATNDNWKTTFTLPCPVPNTWGDADKQPCFGPISNIQLANDIIAVDHRGKIFISRFPDVEWKLFPFPVSDLTYDKGANKWQLTLRYGEVFELNDELDSIGEHVTPIEANRYSLDIMSPDALIPFFDQKIEKVTLAGLQRIPDGPPRGCAQIQRFKERAQSRSLNKKTATLFQQLLTPPATHSFESFMDHFSIGQADADNYYAVIERAREVQKEVYKGNHWNPQMVDVRTLPPLDASAATVDMLTAFLPSMEAEFSSNVLKHYAWSGRGQSFLTITLVNEAQDSLLITSAGAVSRDGVVYGSMGLPWRIQYKDTTMFSFNPELTSLVRDLVPKGFPAAESLLGGSLLYQLNLRAWFRSLKFKNPLKE